MSDRYPHWHAWYDYRRWRKRKRHQLRIEPFCRLCAARGVTTAASVVDHLEPHKGDWNRFWLGELQSLCASCHDSSKRWVELRGYNPKAVDRDGWPIDPRHPANRPT